MSSSQRLRLVLIPLIAGVILTQRLIDPAVAELHKGEKHGSFIGLSNEFILGPMLGLQQAVAGALWVRADEFFHEGDYDAILPIVRMVTWLDPHQLDVYITGAWHLAYNFTDSNERSDRRYIPASQKLLEEGAENNPDVYDIFFELGWQNHDKIKNYERANHWYQLATTKKASDQVTRELNQPVPMFVWHQLAHSFERQGKVDQAIAVWRKCVEMSTRKLEEGKNPNDYTTKNTRDSERHNLELTLKRKYSRFVHEIDWEVDSKLRPKVDPETGEPTPRDPYLYTRGPNIGQPRPPATADPWDTAFEVIPSFREPKKLQIKGRFVVGDGARVTIRLHDEDWREKQLREFTFDIDQDQTIMQDQHSVRAGEWGREIDMSRDPKMYSFSRDYYYLVFEFNPRSTSPFIQDKFGWSGEGMTDKKHLWVDRSKDPPLRMLRKVYRLSKDQIFGAKPITERDVVPNEEYARVVGQGATAKG